MATKRLSRSILAAAIAGALLSPASGSLGAAPLGAVEVPASSGSLRSASRVEDRFHYCGQRDPFRLGYDRFYRRHCETSGLDVMASGAVRPRAVERAAEIIDDMIGHRPDLIGEMVRRGTRVGVIGRGEVTSDMPEYRDIYRLFPGVDWDTRARGLGATPFIPLSSVGEENVLCLPGDVYAGESIMVHEFAHTIRIMGLAFAEPVTDVQIQSAYVAAMGAGRWSNTYAATNSDEYWAIAVQAYFDTAREGPVGGNGVHNHVDTRNELASYDPGIYAIVDGLFADAAPLGLCNG